MDFELLAGVGQTSVCDNVGTSCRSGRLKFDSGASVETPTFSMITRSGSPPHLQWDLLRKLPQQAWINMVPLRDLMRPNFVSVLKNTNAEGSNLKQVAGYDQSHVLWTTVAEVEQSVPDGFNGERDISVFTSSGRSQLSVENFIEFDTFAQPDVTIAISDIQSGHIGSKRQRKAVDRTIASLDKICDALCGDAGKRLLGAIVGGDDLPLRQRSAVETARRKPAGYVIEGLEFGIPVAQRLPIIRKVVGHIPDTKPRILRTTGDPLTILSYINEGIDLLDTAYPVLLAERGRALNAIGFGACTAAGSSSRPCIDLWNTSYAADFTVLNSFLPYTRAYVHHLLTAHEMLATVALTAHNIAVYQDFSAAIRQSISGGTFVEDYAAFVARVKSRSPPS
eukprot:m.71094 g.71094  ORF g.71094 m.71094 type:complete len:394 (-) comp16075_c0_seq1:98-1279(-)